MSGRRPAHPVRRDASAAAGGADNPPGHPPDRLVVVGVVTGAFGVRGEVRLKSFCADPPAIAGYGPLWTEDGTRSFSLTLGRPVANGLSARLSGIDSREEADALRGTRLCALRGRLPPAGDDEFYHADLIGLEVVDTGGNPLGQVRAVFNHGAGDILEIGAHGSPQSVLLPFTRQAVPTVDLAARRIVADPPDEDGAPADHGR